VFINPINDINASDPTGSVYTGNLINQGTADFKAGAKITGSVDITGSLTVNGISITGSATSTYVPFNFGFGTDPTTASFVTIPNVIGGNRAFTLTYQLTSGSASINGGTLQIVGDGGTIGKVDKIAETTLTGAPTASFNAIYSGADLDIKATFTGTSYIISGSYSPFFK
jgi:hypothetical protein